MGAEKIGTMSSLLTPYIVYNNASGLFEVLKSRSNGYSHTSMKKTLDECVRTTEMNEVSSKAWHRSDELNTAIRYMVDMLFTHLHDLITIHYLFKANDSDVSKWNELQQYMLPANELSLPTVCSGHHEVDEIHGQEIYISCIVC